MFFIVVACALGAILFCSHKGNKDRQAKKTSPIMIAWGILTVLGVIVVLFFPAFLFGK